MKVLATKRQRVSFLTLTVLSVWGLSGVANAATFDSVYRYLS